MMRKKNLFHLIKGFFFPEVDQEQENINIKKKGRWLLFRRLKARKRPASILAALSVPSKSDAEEVHHGFEASAHVGSVVPAATEPVDVDSAEAAAGEVAAVLAASSQSMNPEDSESSDGGVGLCSCHKNHPEDLAAIKIQTAFRGYLARKALRALKGLVRLQAIIRGRAVRRRAMTTLKCLQSIVDIQSRICARRCQMVQSRHLLDDKLKMQVSSEGRRDDRLLTKDEANAISLGKKEAMFRRERLKAYSFNHRENAVQSSTESEDERTDGRLNYWLEQHITNAQMPRKEELKKADTNGRKQLRLRNFQRQNCIEDYEHNDPPLLLHRRSLQYHKNRRSVGEDSYFQTSPKFPTYMAATESAKARARRAGSPSLRPKMYSDAYSDGDSPYKHKLSPMSSINSEATVGVYSSQQRSPGLKGLSLRVRSNRSFKDISLESESSLLNWDRHNAFR